MVIKIKIDNSKLKPQNEARHCTNCIKMNSGFNCLHHCHGKELSAFKPKIVLTNRDVLKAAFPNEDLALETLIDDYTVHNWFDMPYDSGAKNDDSITLSYNI